MTGEFTPNGRRYAEVQANPYASIEEAKRELDAFQKEVSALRLKYRLVDLFVVFTAGTREGAVQSMFGFGDRLKWPVLLATAFATEKAWLDRYLRTLTGGAEPEDDDEPEPSAPQSERERAHEKARHTFPYADCPICWPQKAPAPAREGPRPLRYQFGPGPYSDADKRALEEAHTALDHPGPFKECDICWGQF